MLYYSIEFSFSHLKYFFITAHSSLKFYFPKCIVFKIVSFTFHGNIKFIPKTFYWQSLVINDIRILFQLIEYKPTFQTKGEKINAFMHELRDESKIFQYNIDYHFDGITIRYIDKLKNYERLCQKAFNRRLMASKIFSTLTMTPLFTGLLKFSSSKTGKKILETLIPS